MVPKSDALFRICAQHGATRFGTGAAYLALCEQAGARPADRYDISAVRAIISTESPLPESAWRWGLRRGQRKPCSLADCGGPDVCTAFIGTNPLLPVYVGELQAPYLGVRIEAWSAAGEPGLLGSRRNGHHRADAVDAGPVV